MVTKVFQEALFGKRVKKAAIEDVRRAGFHSGLGLCRSRNNWICNAGRRRAVRYSTVISVSLYCVLFCYSRKDEGI